MLNTDLSWELVATFTLRDDENETITNGRLSYEDNYGYYERIHIVCSSSYFTTIRFNREKMGDVLKYISDHSPLDVEKYLETVEGYELLEMNHNL